MLFQLKATSRRTQALVQYPGRKTKWISMIEIISSRKMRKIASGRTRISEHAQSFCFLFSANWISQIWRKVRESRTYDVGPALAQRSRFLLLTKRSAASGNENAWYSAWFINMQNYQI